MSRLADDPRIDPRIKAMMAAMPSAAQTDVASRDALLEELNRPEAVAQREQMTAMLEMLDNEDVAPSKGLDVSTHRAHVEPDGNTIKVQFIRPQTDDVLPCVYYIHGGGMASLSCFDGMYRAWGRIIAAQGVAVAMVDFRNSHDAVVGARGGAVPGRPQRLRVRAAVRRRQRRRAAHRPRPHRRRRRERRRQPHARHRSEAGARRRHRPDPRPLRAVPVHRRHVAAGPLPVVDREQRHPARPAQQPRRRWPTASTSSRPATRWRGRGSPPRTTSRASRPRSSASTSATRCATRASSSTACCCAPASRPAAAR